MKDTANRGKGPICSCGIGELSLPATEDQAGPPNGEAGPQAEGKAVTPEDEGEPVEEEPHKA